MIFKRGNYYYYEFTVRGRRYRATTKTGSKAQALRMEAEHRNRAVSRPGQIGRPQRDTHFTETFAEFLAWSSAHIKPRTHKRYTVSGKRLCAFFGNLGVGSVTGRSVEDFKAQRTTECSKAGVNRDLACLRTFCNWCQRTDRVEKAPYIRLFPEDSHIIRAVSYEEEHQYMGIADTELRKVATLILETGMRPDEVFNPSTRYLTDHVFVTQGKTKHARRTIPLSDRAQAVLTDGRPIISHQVAMRRHKRLGFPFRLYDWRHTFGTRMAMAGVDLMTLRELMGHSSITITQRYCHPSPEHKVRAIQKMEAYGQENHIQ